MTTAMSLADFIKRSGVRMAWKEYFGHRPGWEQADHYKVTLIGPDGRMTVTYSKGIGHKGAPPTVEEVLDTVAMDAVSYENYPDLDDWVAEYGFEDMKEAQKTFRGVKRQSESLGRILGDKLYETLLWHTERS